MRYFTHCEARKTVALAEEPQCVTYRRPNKSIDSLPLNRERLYIVYPLPLTAAKVKNVQTLAEKFIKNPRAVAIYRSLQAIEEEPNT